MPSVSPKPIIIAAIVAVVAAFAIYHFGLLHPGDKNEAVALGAAKTFHQKLNDSKFDDIYSTFPSGMQNANRQAWFLKYVQGVHDKLGAFQSARTEGWGVKARSSGAEVRLDLKSKYANGDADEVFTYFVSGGNAELQDYIATSPVLNAK